MRVATHPSFDKHSRPPPTTMQACGSGCQRRQQIWQKTEKLFTYPKIQSWAVFEHLRCFRLCCCFLSSVNIRTVGTTWKTLAKLAVKVKNGMDWKLKCKKGNLWKIKWISYGPIWSEKNPFDKLHMNKSVHILQAMHLLAHLNKRWTETPNTATFHVNTTGCRRTTCSPRWRAIQFDCYK